MKFFKNFTIKIVKMNLFYVRSPPNIILIEITKLFLLLFSVCIYITYQIKKCVYVYTYNKKNVCVCVYIYVYEGCLDKYISTATWPLKQKFLTPPLVEIMNDD